MEIGNQDIGVTSVILTTAKSKKHKHGLQLVYTAQGTLLGESDGRARCGVNR